ncbi:uncharacterized protein SOCE26_013460 [Sorangium cellulosum]|uniref:Uncharacterized protein n=1 Tax=Sorangium cellulosum TaxID=56 RepID=A0A2L0EKY2_SORCE|nr:uncharacterized protein SOCE26_013460 [Sorangium cellulosum]
MCGSVGPVFARGAATWRRRDRPRSHATVHLPRALRPPRGEGARPRWWVHVVADASDASTMATAPIEIALPNGRVMRVRPGVRPGHARARALARRRRRPRADAAAVSACLRHGQTYASTQELQRAGSCRRRAVLLGQPGPPAARQGITPPRCRPPATRTHPAKSRRTDRSCRRRVPELQHVAGGDGQGEGFGLLRENSFSDGVELVRVDHVRGVDGPEAPDASRGSRSRIPPAEPLAHVAGRGGGAHRPRDHRAAARRARGRRGRCHRPRRRAHRRGG